MNKKRVNICVLDTETLDVITKGVYDVGVTIVTPQGKILKTCNWINSDIYDNLSVFSTAYYQCKRGEYDYLIKVGKALKMNWHEIRFQFNEMMDKYDVGVIAAYNAGFDVASMSNTHIRHRGEKFLTRFFEIWDIMGMACRTILSTNEYHEFAKENGMVSDKGNYRTTAECAYRYIKKDKEFIEHHTALEDTLIETEIMFETLKINPNVDKSIVENAWKLAQ